MNYVKLLNILGKLVKEGQIKSINEAIQMVQKMGAQVDGLLKQGIENLFKTTKARDPDAFKGWMPKVIEGGKKEGVDNLFKETKKVDLPEGVNWKDTPLPVNPKVENFYDDLVNNAYKEAKKTGRDVKTIIEETIDYKFTGNETGKEILDIIEKKFFKADGGRIGYDIGGLTGQAKNIYDSWISAGHSSQDALDYLSSRGMYGKGSEGIESIINTQQNIIPQSGGGNEVWDPNTAQTKMFNKDVWTEIGPGKYDWVDTPVKGFMSPSGWKTAEGKNINHAGIEIPTLVGMLFDKNFGKGPQPGDIKGTFTDGIPKGWGNPLNLFRKQQATLADINAMNKKAWDDLQKQKALEAKKKLEAELAAAAASQPRWRTQGGQDPSGRGNVTTSSGDTWGGSAYGYNEAAEKSDYYKKGGLATMFTRRR